MEPFQTVSEYLGYMQSHPEISTCPIRRCLGVMGGKWKIFIVLQLFSAPAHRFGELARRVEGITNAMLSASLRELERDGMVEREQFNEIPPHVEYRLTREGRSLGSVLLALANWGLEHPAAEGMERPE